MKEIIKLQIKNFRSLEDVEIFLKPNILIFGQNASGKSSFLKAISFFSNYIFHVLNYELLTTNPYIHLVKSALNLSEFSIFNSYKDIVTNNNIAKNIEFIVKVADCPIIIRRLSDISKATIISKIFSSDINLDYLIKYAKDDDVKKFNFNFDDDLLVSDSTNEEQGYYSSFTAQFIFGDSKDEYNLLRTIRFEDNEEKFVFSFLPEFISSNDNIYPHLEAIMQFTQEEDNNVFIKEFLESGLSIIPSFSESNLNQFNKENIKKEIVGEITSYFFRKEKYSSDEAFNNLKDSEKKILYERILKICDIIFIHIPQKIYNIFSRSIHVPSIRELPKHSYPLSGGRFSEKDYFGIPKRLDEDVFDPKLKDKINDVLTNHFEINEIIDLHKEELAGCITTKNQDNETESNISNASSGIQQILPIIFYLLNDYFCSIFTCEQPELHLHPNLQTKLASFFAFQNCNNKIKIIETHSEHIVRKIQVLIAQNKLRRDEVAVYYFNKEDKTGITTVKEMVLDDKGRFIDDWPPGFFDTDTQLALEFFREISKN